MSARDRFGHKPYIRKIKVAIRATIVSAFIFKNNRICCHLLLDNTKVATSVTKRIKAKPPGIKIDLYRSAVNVFRSTVQLNAYGFNLIRSRTLSTRRKRNTDIGRGEQLYQTDGRH